MRVGGRKGGVAGNSISDQDGLTKGMLSPDDPAPKLKAYAAEVRGLVPVVGDLAKSCLDPADATEQCILAASAALRTCYDTLSSQSIFAGDLLQEAARKFSVCFVALDETVVGFRVKPKLHSFQELTEMRQLGRGSTPKAWWTYRDEDFGGTLARLATSRGGPRSARTAGLKVLLAFAARNPIPCFT